MGLHHVLDFMSFLQNLQILKQEQDISKTQLEVYPGLEYLQIHLYF